MKRITWVMGFVLAVGAFASETRLEIVVHVHNAASVPQSELREAETTAGWMFQKAGIHVQWVDCNAQACGEPDDPKLFVLSITPDSPPDHSDGVLGFAMLQGRANRAIAVYSHVAEKALVNRDYRDSNLLGNVMAHELGHLLFHSRSHGDGIMRGQWTDEDFYLMRQRRLSFTATQAATLRGRLTARIKGW